MRRNKNLLGMSGALLSTATKSCSPYLLSLGASAAAPSSSPSLFRVRQPSGGGEPGHPPPPILSGPARLAAVALLSLFAVVNLRLADGSERGGFFGDLSLASFGGADGGVGPPRRYIRGVTMRESWIGPSSQPFVRTSYPIDPGRGLAIALALVTPCCYAYPLPCYRRRTHASPLLCASRSLA
jgi:hypothetical protein